MRQKTLRFDDILNEAIDEVIRNVFESETANTILGYFKESSSKELDERVQVFADSLPKILGVGSVIIEDLILETLYLKYDFELKRKKGYEFRNYVMELRDRTGEGAYEAQLNIVG